jgi:hypothetical protein
VQNYRPKTGKFQKKPPFKPRVSLKEARAYRRAARQNDFAQTFVTICQEQMKPELFARIKSAVQARIRRNMQNSPVLPIDKRIKA